VIPSSRTSRRVLALAASTILALAGAACGDDDDDGGAADTSTTAAAVQSTTTAPADQTQPAGSALVEVARTALGDVLVSGGMTLYAFMPDEGGMPTCYDQCASTWPPLLADGAVSTGEGLDASAFTTVARTDGGDQVVANGWPLYFFANDAAPGDTNGQGIGDRWFVVGPDGEPIR
jgi:predicted lipoprotein with Yx(FWY)xxD motif